MKKSALFPVLISGLMILGASSTLTIASALTTPEQAYACKDCPFPMRIADGRWLMPGGLSELSLVEKSLGGKRVKSILKLVDVHSRKVLAEGEITHNRGRKRLYFHMKDSSGAPMEAEVYFPKVTRSDVQVRITCMDASGCNLHSSYYN